MVITNKLMEVFPKRRDERGFELLKMTGSTRSPLAYLKAPATMIGQATVYIRPLQQDLSLDCVITFVQRETIHMITYHM